MSFPLQNPNSGARDNTADHTSGDGWRTLLALSLLTLMSLAIVLERWHTIDEPLDQDIAGYAVLSHEMLQGRKLYSDLWERKPPAIFATFAAAESIVGYGPREIFLLSVAAGIGTMLCLWRAGGIFAAALWTLLSGDLWVAGNQPNAEVFVNLCLSGALAILLKQGHSRWRGLVVGLLLAAATLFKHHVIIICLALLAADMLRRRDRSAMVDTIIATGVIAVSWFAVCGYFLALGRFGDFYSALVAQNLAYAGSVLTNVLHALLWVNWFTAAMRWMLLPVILLFLWMICRARKRDDTGWLILAAYAISAWIVVALPGYFWAHYYQLLLPPACMAGGWAAMAMVGGKQRFPAPARYAVITALFVAEACWQWSSYRLSPEQISREKYTKTDLPEQQALGQELDRILLPQEHFWELGEANEIYFASRRSPPSGLLYLEPLEFGPERQIYAARLLSDLVRTKPEMILVDLRWTRVLPQNDAILPWIRVEYVPDDGRLSRYTYRIFLRRGSDLARRLGVSTR